MEISNIQTKKHRLKHTLTTLALLSGLAVLPAFFQKSSGETNAQPPMPPLWSILEDADQDGMTDVDELLWGMDPFNPEDGLSDVDGDEIPLAWEFAIGTNPSVADTDLDFWSDAEEYLLYGTDPLDFLSFPLGGDIDGGEGSATESAIPEPEAAPPPTLSNGDFSDAQITTWKSMENSTQYQGKGFVWNAGTVGSWTAYVGSTVEVWEAGGERFVELDGSTDSYGIKQEIKNAKAGGYVLTWRESGRNSAKAGDDPYCVRVYYLDGAIEKQIGQSVFPKLDKSRWINKAFAFQITPEQFAAAKAKGAPIYVAYIPTGSLNTYGTLIDKVSLLPFELDSDLNNDGKIDSADSGLRVAATKQGASDADIEKGTEYIFQNDHLSNGAWDIEDTGAPAYDYPMNTTMDPPPASHDADDDAQELKITLNANFGAVWFDHPAANQLSLYRTKACKETDRIPISYQTPLDLSSQTLPTTVYLRADGWFTTESEGKFALVFGKADKSQEYGRVELQLTVVLQLGDDHFFHAARDYIGEQNTKLFIHDRGFPHNLPPAPAPSIMYRLCVMREEAASLKPMDCKGTTGPYSFGPHKGIEAAAKSATDATVLVNGNQCFFTAGYDEGNWADLPSMFNTIADKCHGRCVYDGVETAISSDNYDPTTTPAKGSALAGPDPIPATPAANPGAGPDGVPGTADDATIPLAGSAGGKYVGYQTQGLWSFAAGQTPKGGSSFYGLGGLSTKYDMDVRADKAHQMIGYAPVTEDHKGCVFTATQIRGVGYAPQFKQAAAASGVPALSPSADANAVKLFILDSGMGSVGLMHLDGAGTLKNAFIGRKHRTNVPYHVLDYLAIKASKPRP